MATMVDPDERMTMSNPYFLQYEVRPNRKNSEAGAIAGAIATLIVFAGTAEIARARAGRHIALCGWEIVEVKRGMRVGPHHLETLDGVLKTLYGKARSAGIAAVFDGWKKAQPRCGM